MSQQQPQRPITYGDVFEHVQGELASQPITVEDAALMQSAETVNQGKTQKGGAASTMQSAADTNVNVGVVDPKAHSNAAEQGFGMRSMVIDGKVLQEQFVGEHQVANRRTFIPTFAQAAAAEGITIGEALQEAASNDPLKVVEEKTARAIQSAEARATGIPAGLKEGPGATAQSAAQKNAQGRENITLSQVLSDATEKMPFDKVVTQEDVEKTKRVEGSEGNISRALQEAVDTNEDVNRFLEKQANNGGDSISSLANNGSDIISSLGNTGGDIISSVANFLQQPQDVSNLFNNKTESPSVENFLQQPAEGFSNLSSNKTEHIE